MLICNLFVIFCALTLFLYVYRNGSNCRWRWRFPRCLQYWEHESIKVIRFWGINGMVIICLLLYLCLRVLTVLVKQIKIIVWKLSLLTICSVRYNYYKSSISLNDTWQSSIFVTSLALSYIIWQSSDSHVSGPITSFFAYKTLGCAYLAQFWHIFESVCSLFEYTCNLLNKVVSVVRGLIVQVWQRVFIGNASFVQISQVPWVVYWSIEVCLWRFLLLLVCCSDKSLR